MIRMQRCLAALLLVVAVTPLHGQEIHQAAHDRVGVRHRSELVERGQRCAGAHVVEVATNSGCSWLQNQPVDRDERGAAAASNPYVCLCMR